MKAKHLTIICMAIAVIAGGWILFFPNYEGNSLRHFSMELVGAFLALSVAIVAFNASLEKREGLTSYIGVGFLIAGLTDLLHALFAMGVLWIPEASLGRFIPGTWTAGRTALAVILFIGVINVIRRPARLPSVSRLAALGGGLMAVAVVIFALIPLPAFILENTSPVKRPWELLSLVLFVITFWLIARRTEKGHLSRSLLCMLAIGSLAQISMAFSLNLYGRPFDAAHVVKDISYMVMFLPMVVLVWRRAKKSFAVASARILTGASILFLGFLIATTSASTYILAFDEKRDKAVEALIVTQQIDHFLSRAQYEVQSFIVARNDQERLHFETEWAALQEALQDPMIEDIHLEFDVNLREMARPIGEISEQVFAFPPHTGPVELKRALSEVDSVFHAADDALERLKENLVHRERRLEGSEHYILRLLDMGQLSLLLLLLPVIFILGAIQQTKHIRPVIHLTEVARKMQEGDYETRAIHEAEDEIGLLSGSFNTMVEALKAREAGLEVALNDTETIVNEVPTGMIISGMDRRVRLANRAVLDLLGMSSEKEIIGELIDDCICEPGSEGCPIFEKGQQSARGEYSIPGKDGKNISVLKSSRRISIQGEEVVLISITDITQRKLQEAELEKARDELEKRVKERTAELTLVRNDLTRLIETANAPIFGVDVDGRINEWNAMAAKITGYSHGEAMGRDFIATLIPDEYSGPVGRVLTNALAGEETQNYESPILTKDGDTVHILLNSTSRRDDQGNIVGVVGVGQDITERKRVERELAEERNSLEVTVELRTRELKESLDRLRDANLRLEETSRHKSRFLSSMSHELRTPLNAVLGFADLLDGQFFGKLNEKQHGYITEINKSGKHLLSLINDLLNMARIDAGVMQLELETFSLNDFIKETVSMMGTQFRKKELSVSSFIDENIAEITADRHKSAQILLNLLSNAAKFSHRGGNVEVRATSEGESRVKISVSDTGVGIASEDQKHIFSEFYQSDRIRDEQLGGTGIGLAISSRLVALHGGEIGVKSAPGVGSTFWFTLPTRRLTKDEKIVDRPEETGVRPKPRGRHILVAEDNDANLNMLLDMLSIHGHEVVVARNGREAVELAKAHKPELILMDIRMPVVDGLEATRQLRAMPEFADVPIVALTASVGTEAEKRHIDAGCTAHLSKPIQSRELFDMLGRFLKADKQGHRVT